jgi:RNA polymerase sigma factor (sigma-70 family)
MEQDARLEGVDPERERARSEEQRLVARTRDGDKDAFRQLYENNVDGVARFLASRVPSSEVDDFVAEVFLRAWKSREKFEDRGYRYISWLLRIAQNLVISKSRRPIKEEPGLDGHDPSDSDPMDRVVDQMTGSSLRQVLHALPQRQRMVLELRFVEDLSSAEVGEILGISGEAVRQLTVRSLRQVRSLVGPLTNG